MRLLTRLLSLAVVASVVVLGGLFVRANPGPVRIGLPFTGELPELPLWQALGLAFGLGLALAAAAGLYQGAKLGLRARHFRKASEKLAAEVHQLRNLPLTSEGEGSPRGSAGGLPEVGEPVRSAGRRG